MRKMSIPDRETRLSIALLLLSLVALSACKSPENQAIAEAVSPDSTAIPAAPTTLNMIAVIDQPFVVNKADFRLSNEHHVVQIDGLPSWLSFDPSEEELHGSPAIEDIGIHDRIVLESVDGLGLFQSHYLTIEVTAISSFTVEFSWSAPAQRTDGSALTNLAGFRIFAGRSQHDMEEWVTIENPTVDRHTIENLGSGRWWFALSAYDSNGAESEKSAAVSRHFN